MQMRAIAIFHVSPEGEVKKVDSAQKTSSMFFEADDLKSLETAMTHLPDDMKNRTIACLKLGGEYQYVEKRENFFLAISSRKKITKEELPSLFININHTRLRKDILKISLQNILENPIGFIGRDLLTESIINTTAEVKDICIKNIESIIARGEKLEELEAKSIMLETDSLRFSTSAKKLNRCCPM